MSVQKYARRIARLEKDVFNGATQPRLPYSALDGGSIQINDGFGNLHGVLGEQYDGSVTVAILGGPPLPSPSTPLVTPVQGGLGIYWDGTWVDGSITRMDFQRVTFHAVLDVDDFDAVDPAQIVGEITIATGGEVFATLPPDEHFIFAVAWSQSGVFSFQSDVAFGTPLSLIDEAEWQAHEAALTELNDVTLPALQSDLDANANALVALNDITLPALQTDLDANADALTLLNTSTLPALQAEAAAAQEAADAATQEAADAIEAALAAAAAAGSAQAAADGAIRTYGPEEYPTNPPWPDGSSQPSTVVGDLWLDSEGVAHRWNGSIWYVIPDSAAAAALAAAVAAQDDAADAAAAATTAYERWAPSGQTTIDGGNITADSITAAQIGADQVTANEIAADTITANEIAANAITVNELAANAVTAAKIAALTITAAQIAANTITAAKIAADTITANELAADAITVTELKADAITSKHTITGAIVQTIGTVARGIKLSGSNLTAYDGSGNANVVINGTTGTLTVSGPNSSITGAVIRTAASPAERLEINTTSQNSQISFYSGNVNESSPSLIRADDDYYGNINTPHLFLQGGLRAGFPGTRYPATLALVTRSTNLTEFQGYAQKVNLAARDTLNTASGNGEAYLNLQQATGASGIATLFAGRIGVATSSIQLEGGEINLYPGTVAKVNGRTIGAYEQYTPGDYSGTLSSNVSTLRREDKVVYLSLDFRHGSSGVAGGANLLVVAAGAGNGHYFKVMNRDTGGDIWMYVTSDGFLRYVFAAAAGSGVVGTTSWILP